MSLNTSLQATSVCRGSVLPFSERHANSPSAFLVKASSNFVAEAVGSSEPVMGPRLASGLQQTLFQHNFFIGRFSCLPCTPVDVPSIIPGFNQVLCRAGQRHKYLTMLPKSAKARKEPFASLPKFCSFSPFCLEKRTKWKCTPLNKKEKAIFFLTQENCTTWFSSIFCNTACFLPFNTQGTTEIRVLSAI